MRYINTIFFLLFVACGGLGESDSITPADFSGVSLKSGTFTVYEFANGTQGSKLAIASFADEAIPTLKLKFYRGPVYVELRDAVYVDPYTEPVVTFAANDQWSAILDYQGGEITVAVNPITSMAASYTAYLVDVKKYGVTDAILKANTEVGDLFGKIDIIRTLPSNLNRQTTTSPSSNDELFYGIALYGLGNMAHSSGKNLVLLSQEIAADFKIGLTSKLLTNNLASDISDFMANSKLNQTGLSAFAFSSYLSTLSGASSFSSATPIPTNKITYSALPVASTLTTASSYATSLQSMQATITTKYLNFNPPPSDTTAATTLIKQTEFLYTGPNRVQFGVAPGTIKATQASVVRGKVKNRQGTIVSNVQVTVLHHPELGTTFSRQDGKYDMASNNGEKLTIQYFKPGYLPVQRDVTPRWQDFATLPDVVMTPLDPQVTTVALSSPAMQVAQGSVSTDTRGVRRATVLIPSATQATLVMPDGSTQPVSNIHVRATEYTVGDTGPQAMPGTLPPSSAYTYAVELSADEAITAGAKSVAFNQALPTYVDNFINFPVGTAVPTGYYDRTRGVWVPSDNGRVIKILSISGGLAELDIDGSDNPASPVNLSALGVSTDERMKLANLYTVGKTLWRVPVKHFTPYDCNWPYGLPPDATAPNQPHPKTDDGDIPDDPCLSEGSIIECESQILRDTIPIVGSPYSLNYSSDRAPGRIASRTIKISLAGPTLPQSLKRIELHLEIAGKIFEHTFPSTTNQNFTYVWDGKNNYGQIIQGSVSALVKIGYVYNGFYYSSTNNLFQSFGQFGSSQISGTIIPQELVIWQESLVPVTILNFVDAAIGGWSISPHHFYNAADYVLFAGDGSRRSVKGLGETIIETVAGGGNFPVSGPHTDGSPALGADVSISNVAILPDGSYYFSDEINHVVFHVGLDGLLTRIAGIYGTQGYSGDNTPAVTATLSYPKGLAIAPDGNLFIGDHGNAVIRQVTPNGIITTFAGSHLGGFGGDGGPATQAKFEAFDIALGPDGSLYIADLSNKRIRKVDTNGIINTVAGNGSNVFVDGVAATESGFTPYSVTVSPGGFIYIGSDSRILRVDPTGIIASVAGTGATGFSGDGGPAMQAKINLVWGLTAPNDDEVYFVDQSNQRIRHIDAAGFISTVVGKGTGVGQVVNGSSPLLAPLLNPTGVKLFADGRMLIPCYGGLTSNHLYRVRPTLPGFSGGDIGVVSKDSELLYRFDPAGRHLETIDTRTNAALLTFNYDTSGRLKQIHDGNNNTTTIHYNASGAPTSIVAPFGQTTTFETDSNGYLTKITNPANQSHQFTYTSDGLMLTEQDPLGNSHSFTYGTTDGRLTFDQNPSGGSQTISRLDMTNKFEVTRVTGMGRQSKYSLESLATGDIQRIITSPDNTQITRLEKKDASNTITDATGFITAKLLDPDPRFGMQAPIAKSYTATAPSNLQLSIAEQRTVTLSDPSDFSTLVTLTNIFRLNNLSWQEVYTAANKSVATTSPLGRTTNSIIDAQGRLTEFTLPPFAPVTLHYDNNGRLDQISQGSGVDLRLTNLAYNPQSYLDTIINPLTQSASFEYDLAARITKQILPDGREIRYTYDDNGNLISLQPPGNSAHRFEYTPINLGAKYLPPAVTGSGTTDTVFTYNIDRQLTQINRPDGQLLLFDYHPTNGKLLHETFGTLQNSYDYFPTTGLLQRITASDGGTLTYTYNGSLPTSTTWAGAVSGSVSRLYTNSFLTWTLSVNGANSISFVRDQDNLLTNIGSNSLIISRSPLNGLITGTSFLSNTTETITYNNFGEVATYNANYTSASKLSETYSRDKLGRITNKLESLLGAPIQSYDYTYDPAGRLIDVSINGSLGAHYTYDSNSNRLTKTGIPATATYDGQDRLLTYNGSIYTYTANGERLTKTTGPQTTTYTYDVFGNLKQVVMPTKTIDYITDGLNRRIGKKINDIFTQKFLYQDGLRIIAELNPDNTVLTRFVYATRPNVPDYMIKSGATYRIISDHLGSPRLIINTAGTVVQRLDYDEFGIVLLDTNPGFQPFGFAGGIYDKDTKLVRFGARDYDAETGRWTSKDPIGFNGGDSNLYGYVVNDPVNWVDPNGFKSIKVSGYWGMGGSVTIGSDHGQAFVKVGVGVGVGGGFKFYPTGSFPGISEIGPRGIIGSSCSVSSSLGPLSAEYKAQAEVLFSSDSNGSLTSEYFENSGFEGSIRGKVGSGLSLGASLNFFDVGLAW
jgi:RHS repeat-associated protein